MNLTNKFNFIILDDSLLDCFIAEKIIKNTGKAASIKSFHHGKELLDYLSAQNEDDNLHTIILVDIQMPLMNGFEFVEAFEQLPLNIVRNYSIYMISSSINDNDLNRVHYFSSIKQFLNKPITSNNLSLLIAKN